MSFSAVQTYSDGTETAWIDPTVAGQPEPEHPAPALTIAAASDPAPATGSSGLAVTALVVGIVGVLAGIAGIALAVGARRRTAPSPSQLAEPEPEDASV